MYDKNGDLVDTREMLRVKVKSLAEESRIIRREASKTNGSLRYQLQAHRREVVRPEARAAHLALGFIKGRNLEQMERKRRPEPRWITAKRHEKVVKLCRKYGPSGFNGPPPFDT